MIKVGGKQILAEFECHNRRLLNDGEKLESALVQAAVKNGFSVKTKFYQFTPYGITAVAILGESHIIIYTYPEYNHMSLDCYTCFGNPNKIVDELIRKLGLVLIQRKEVARGIEISESEQQKNWLTDYGGVGHSPRGVVIKYHIKKSLFSRRSKYQQIDIIENDDFGKMLFLDNDLQMSEHDTAIYDSNLISPIIKKRNLSKVLILGGGDGSIANELLKKRAQEITLVDIDSDVVRACKKFMPEMWGVALKNPRVEIIIADAYQYLKENNKKFDAVIYDLTAHPEENGVKKNQKVFLDNIFSDIKRNLRVGGIMTMQCCEESDEETLRLIQSALKKYFSNIKFVKAFVPSYCVRWVFACAKNK